MDATIASNWDGRAEPSTISSTLLDRIRARRPDAWQRLVDLYGPVVYRWCRQLGVGSADAADCVQEVFAAVAAGIGQFHRDRPGDSFGAWLRTITRSKVADHFRRRQGRPDAEGGTTAYQQLLNLPQAREKTSSRDISAPPNSMQPNPAPADASANDAAARGSAQTDSLHSRRLEFDAKFARRVLDAVRAEFEPRTWEAFWRIVVDEQSPADVAAAMGMTLPAVYKAKSRVLQRLRRELADSNE